MPYVPKNPIREQTPEASDFSRGPSILRLSRIKPKESANGGMTQEGGITVTKVDGLNSYFTWYDTDGVVFASINSLAESAVGQGYFTKVDEDADENPKLLVDELGEKLDLDTHNGNICRLMLIAGFVPVETKLNKFSDKSIIKIIHPLTVESFAQDSENNILWVKQRDPNGVPDKGKKIDGKNITWFAHNVLGNDLRGTSVIKPVEQYLSTKQTALENMDGIIDRKLFPVIIFKSVRDIGGMRAAVTATEAGEDLYFGNLTPEEMAPGALFEALNISGETKYWEYVEYIDILIYRGLYAPDLYYWKDATLASARELTAMTDRHVQSIQRDMKRAIEYGFFRRFLDLNSIVDETPRVMWGVETTGVEELQMENVISTMLQIGMMGPKQATRLLKLMGLNIGELGYNLMPEDEDEEEPEEDEDEEPVEDEEDGDDEE